MIGWLLDTNVVGALLDPNGAPSVKAWAARQREDDFYLSVLTLGEYDKGIHNLPEDHPRRAGYSMALEKLELRFRGRVLPVSNDVVRRWGRTSGLLKREMGHAPQVVDTLLAATAIENSLYLATRNVKDTQGSGATIFNPWTDDVTDFPLNGQAERRPPL